MIWREPIFLTHDAPPRARESFALKENEPGFVNNLLIVRLQVVTSTSACEKCRHETLIKRKTTLQLLKKNFLHTNMVAQLSCFLHNARRDIYNRTELCHVVNYVRFSYY